MVVGGLVVLAVIAYAIYLFYKWLRSIEASPYSPMHQLLGEEYCCCNENPLTGPFCCGGGMSGQGCPTTEKSCRGRYLQWMPKSQCSIITKGRRAKMPHYGMQKESGYMPMY